jgi:photosystem II protein
MNTYIEFLEGIPEKSLPFIKLTKSKNGKTGTATFVFYHPSIFTCDSSFSSIDGMSLIWDTNKMKTTDLQIIYKNGKHKYINFPNRGTKKWDSFYNDFDNDTNVETVLSSPLSQDAYELGLYPKAKNKTVEFVIKNYKKYFKPINHPKNITEMFMRKVWTI